jgi:zinc protease
MNRFSANAPQKRPDPTVYARRLDPIGNRGRGEGIHNAQRFGALVAIRPSARRMSVRKRWTFLALAVAAATAANLCRAAEVAEVADLRLDNGLEIVVVPDHRTPVVTHMIWYRVGSADETPGKSGLAHFLEHLMFKGTARTPAGKFAQAINEVGGQENAFTSSDYTAFYQRVPREQLETVMGFEADRMTGLVLTDANVLPERDVVLEEQNQRVANDPAARLTEQVQAALYLNHPYGRPVIGWRHEIEALTREDALAFYRRFYTPNNAIVVVAGDVSAEEIAALARATYAKVPRRSEPGARARPQEPEPVSMRQVTLADPRVAQPSLQRSYLVPSFAAGQADAEALDLLAHILGAGQTSRLYRALVVDQGVAVDAGAWYQGLNLDATRFGVYGSPRPGIGLQRLEAALDAVIADVAEHGVTADELARAKTRLIADFVYAQDNQLTLARFYGLALTTGFTLADLRARPERIRAVGADAVREAARRWLDKRRSVTGYLVKDPTRGDRS